MKAVRQRSRRSDYRGKRRRLVARLPTMLAAKVALKAALWRCSLSDAVERMVREWK